MTLKCGNDMDVFLNFLGVNMDILATIVAANNYLQKCYINSRYSPTVDDWPPYQPRHYTTLALIHHKDKCTDATVVSVTRELAVAGNLFSDSISQTTNIYSNTTKNISHIFVSVTARDGFTINPCIVLIEGAPGIGKTVLAKEIAFQWANGKLLVGKKILLLVFLQHCNFKNIVSIESFIQYVVKSNEMATCLAKYLLQTEGKDLAIVFDGYDDVSENDRKCSIIADIICRRIFAKCCLVITSRPTASLNLRWAADCRVEVVGFTEEDRLDYIQTALQGNDDQIKALTLYLQSNPTINALCYIPLNMTILLCLVEDNIDKLPKTQTDMYEKFIIMTIVRFIQKVDRNISTVITSIAKLELPYPYNVVFEELALLAYKTLVNDQIIFTLSEIAKICPNLTRSSSNQGGLGLLNVVQYFNDTIAFHFLHFSIQEYMAAWYISTLSNKNQIRLLKETFWQHRFHNTWMMYTGLTCGESFAFKHFLSGNWFQLSTRIFKTSHISKKYLENKIKCLHLVQCLSESNNEDMIASVSRRFFDNQIDLSNQTLLPSNITTLAFFLLKSFNKQWKMLNLSGCNIGSIGSNILCDTFLNSSHIVIIRKIDFSHNQLTLSALKQLFSLFKSWCVSDITIIDSKIRHSNREIYAVIEDSFTLYKSHIKVTLQFKTFFFAHGIHIERPMVAFKNVYLLNCEWVLTDVRPFIVELRNFHLINSSFPCEFLKAIYNALLLNAAKDIKISNDEETSLFVYNNALLDQDFNEIGSLMSREIIYGVMLIISKGQVQGMINIVTLSSVLSKLEILNLIVNIRIMCCNNMQTCSWRHDLCSTDNKSDLIIYTFIELLHKIACKHCTCCLRIALKEKDTLIGHNVKYNTLKNILIAYGPTRVVHLSDCDIQSEEYEILCRYATKIYIYNSHLDKAFIFKMLSVTSSSKEVFMHSLCDINTNAITPSNLQRWSILLVTKDILIGCKPTTEQIMLALQMEPLVNVLKLYDCQGNFEFFDQIIAILGAASKSWAELDLSNCSIGEVECEILYRNLKAENFLSTVKTLKISLAKLTLSVLPKLIHIILMWKVKDIYFYGIYPVFYKHFIKRICTDNTSSGDTSLSVSYNNENICLLSNFSWTSITSILTVENMSFIGYNLSSRHNDHSYQIYIINRTLHENMQSQKLCVTCSTQLQEIDMSDYDLQVTGTIIISNSSPKLTKLCINKKSITEILADDIASTISCNSYIQELDISDNNIQVTDIKIILKALNISTLIKLCISKNNITDEAADDIAAAISCNSQLQELDISDNELQDTGTVVISKALQCLSTIKKLYINKNNITDEAAEDIAAAVSLNSQLQELDISDNDIQATGAIVVSKALQNLSTLTKFYISKNNITDKSADYIAAAISFNTQLQELDISDNDLQTTGAIAISKALQDVSTLTKLYLNKNNITDEVAIYLAVAITCNSGLQELEISDNDLQATGAITILKALEDISTLTKLHISKNNITDKAAIHVAHVISCNTQLQELDISDNDLQASGTAIISEALQGISTLTKLCISKNNITNDKYVANQIAAAITCNTQLQELDISKNYLKTQSAIKILGALQGISTLTKLYINDNNIAENAANYIVVVVSRNIHLQEVDVSNNYLQTSGIIVILRALRRISTLTKLSISRNNISNEAANHIAAIIPCNTKLQELDISDNNLQTSGALRILKALQHISTLTKLYISKNNITKRIVDDVAVVISCNTQLQELDICENELPASAY